MLETSNLLGAHKRRSTWRQAYADDRYREQQQQQYQNPRKTFAYSSKFTFALLITVIIVISQVFIVHYYLGLGLGSIFRRGSSGAKNFEELLFRHNWLCHSYPYLSDVTRLAQKHHVELIIIDPDFLFTLENDNVNNQQESQIDIEFADGNHKSNQAPGQQKTIIHLAAINETSGGQPNLKSFYKALKNNSYVMLKYDDASQTMPHEVYQRPSHQFDDVQSDAIRDLNHLEQLKGGSTINTPVIFQSDFEISKIYTEFISHIFILNNTRSLMSDKCKQSIQQRSATSIVIHILVLYNYEYRPADDWIQSSLHLDEIDRHKLLAYGVHSIDFKVPLEHYYVHPKRDAVKISEFSKYIVKTRGPFSYLKIFQPQENRLLTFANNTYLHCKPESFNMTGLIDGNRKISNYIRVIDSARPPEAEILRHNLDKQMAIALQFMNVFSKSYGNFSFWMTGSSLLAYHKFCQLTIVPEGQQMDSAHRALGSYAKELEIDNYRDVVVNFELGMFASELSQDMLRDLSGANMIGVTMITDWQRPNAHISFRVDDCPSLIFHLYPYELQRDFYHYYFTTKDNLTFNHKFRRKQSSVIGDYRPNENSTVQGHHVFNTNNLKLCWTRIDLLDPFRVPCDVHDHLRRIYII